MSDNAQVNELKQQNEECQLPMQPSQPSSPSNDSKISTNATDEALEPQFTDAELDEIILALNSTSSKSKLLEKSSKAFASLSSDMDDNKSSVSPPKNDQTTNSIQDTTSPPKAMDATETTKPNESSQTQPKLDFKDILSYIKHLSTENNEDSKQLKEIMAILPSSDSSSKKTPSKFSLTWRHITNSLEHELYSQIAINISKVVQINNLEFKERRKDSSDDLLRLPSFSDLSSDDSSHDLFANRRKKNKKKNVIEDTEFIIIIIFLTEWHRLLPFMDL